MSKLVTIEDKVIHFDDGATEPLPDVSPHLTEVWFDDGFWHVAYYDNESRFRWGYGLNIGQTHEDVMETVRIFTDRFFKNLKRWREQYPCDKESRQT
jgi:hypothetical protein